MEDCSEGIWVKPVSWQVGSWFIAKYREQAKNIGYAKTALNLKKQGVPFDIAKAILRIR